MTTNLYDQDFFEIQRETLRSARILAPKICELVRPTSVVDVGCGIGNWLLAFKEVGVSRVRGLDGAYVNRKDLLIAPEEFIALDLSQPFGLNETFDLALCLEVGEHLPERVARGLVQNLVKMAPVVAFSAAVPGQGGTGHINEQWPPYWDQLFRSHKYQLLDPIRPAFLNDQRVHDWYRQNMVLYVAEDRLKHDTSLHPYIISSNKERWIIVRPAMLYDKFGVLNALRLWLEKKMSRLRSILGLPAGPKRRRQRAAS